jgi:peptidoglycan/xylan/chitin deacetylase (PgdA/CDA1 family)
MRFGPWRKAGPWWRGALAVLFSVVVGCTSTSQPSPSVVPSELQTAGGSPSASFGTSASLSPGPSSSPGESSSPSIGSPPPPESPGPSGSPGPTWTPGPSLTPDPAFILPDWEPWPAQFPGSPSAIVSQGPRKPIIALTIDDGNFPEGCAQEFAYLSSSHIPATFFPDWVGVHKDPDLWREIAAAGYPIANHTLTHLDLAGPDVEDHSVRRQLAEARQRIEKIIGRSMLPVWRPPYGSFDARDLQIAGELGLHTTVLWSASDADSGPNSKPDGMVRAALRAEPGDILLTHCNTQTSADILPAIVQGLLAKGYTFVTIPDLLRPYGLGG